jgi:alkaline phosphatase D
MAVTPWIAGLLLDCTAHAAATPKFPQSVASGDPTPSSVILWTRLDPASAVGNTPAVGLEVATDPAFQSIVLARTNLVALPTHDYCVKVRVASLAANTRYYYRFVYQGEHSAVGRTKTAPDPTQAVPLRFAFISCQDYIGRYYNTLANLVHREADSLDFVVHLGDYIYETAGNPSFQTTNSPRSIVFRDLAGAKKLGTATAPFYAASSLDNYRQLYQTYRNDPVVQDLHEHFPMVNIWDDHEFANDAWGANSTDSDGKLSEFDPDRRRHAEQAYFEYIPIGVGANDQGITLDASVLYPNAQIYRNLQFGSLMTLFLTDYRSYRPDHLIPEDAFPATIVLTESVLSTIVGADWKTVRLSFDPYVNIDDPAYAVLKSQLQLGTVVLYQKEGIGFNEALTRASKVVTGNVSVSVINAALAAAGVASPFTPAAIAALPRGLSYAYLGKQTVFAPDGVGARYLLARDMFKIYAGYLAATNPNSQNALGDAQVAELTQALSTSTSPWKIVTSSVTFCPLGFDFSHPPIPLPPTFPDTYKLNLQLNADDWDGFPDMRRKLLDLYGAHDAVVISGDIHSSFVTSYQTSNGRIVPEFTGPAVSSETFQDGVKAVVKGTAALASIPGVDQLVAATDLLVRDAVNKSGYATSVDTRTDAHGYVVVDVAPDQLVSEYRHIDSSNIATDWTGAALSDVLDAHFTTSRYVVTRDSAGNHLAVVPGLSASRDAQGNLRLSWPATNPGCQLEGVEVLTAVTVWQAVASVPVVTGGVATVTLPPGSNLHYFRLLCR